MAHISGLVAGGVHPSPVPHAGVVTTTTHKTLRGPRGGVILCRHALAEKVDKSVFPGLQGGPLMHIIAAKAVAFGEALTPDFSRYAARVVENAGTLASTLLEAGVDLVSGGTDNHLLLLDLRRRGLTGKIAEEALHRALMTVNKNAVPNDPQKPWVTSGVRIGTPALTTRGMGVEEMRLIGQWIARVLDAPEDEAIGREVAAQVRDLSAAFPTFSWSAVQRAGVLDPRHTPLPAEPVSGAGAEDLGLDAGTPVVAGPFDLPACARGAGVTELGDGLLIVGTTLACQVLVDRIDTSGPPAGMSLSTPRPGRWMRAMPSMVGTASLDWILRVLDMKHKQIDKALRNSSPGAGGVEALPYFAPSGERSPFIAPEAVGQFVGIQLTTTRQDLIRATCEGLAYAARDCFEAAGLTGTLMVAGGGARSVPWLRIFASVLNRPLYVASSPQVGAKGAVQAALDVVGVDYDRQAWGRAETVIEPDTGLIELYEDGFGRYRQLRDAARPLWRAK